MINGVIVIRKEQGFTSHDVVAKMRGICGQKKIGHTGTLDPEATGVLPVCLGSGTKLCDMLADRDKEYVAELLLGVTTDTQDTTGTVLAEQAVKVTEDEVRKVCESFVGDYNQIPPMYSALKVGGKKLYELAREGKSVERQARPVRILELEILQIELPVVKMRVVCSKGTYIRTLCDDIGRALGCGGAMKSLERTRVGAFTLEDAVTLGKLQQLKDAGKLTGVVLPVDRIFDECPKLHVTEEFVRLLDNGNAILQEQTEENIKYDNGRWIRFYRMDESFAGVYAYDSGKGRYQPVKMFLERE